MKIIHLTYFQLMNTVFFARHMMICISATSHAHGQSVSVLHLYSNSHALARAGQQEVVHQLCGRD